MSILQKIDEQLSIKLGVVEEDILKDIALECKMIIKATKKAKKAKRKETMMTLKAHHGRIGDLMDELTRSGGM
jgi:protein-arginine kinase